MDTTIPNANIYPDGVAATYHEAILPEWCDNPLIEVLPPICSAVQARGLLKYFPVYAIANTAGFFTPIPIHLALYQQIGRMVRSGYANRNPMVTGYGSGEELTRQSSRCASDTKDE
jgi:hypothetical protein